MKTITKIALAFGIIAAAEITSSAQVGINIGASIPNIREVQYDPVKKGTAYGIGGNIGVDYNIPIIAGFSIVPGLYYNFTKVDDGGFEGQYSVDEHIFDHTIKVPVHFKYEFNIKPDKFAIYLYAGPVLSIGTSSTFKISVMGVDILYDNYSGDIQKMTFGEYPWNLVTSKDKQAMKDLIQNNITTADPRLRRLDLGCDAGVGFRFAKHWELKTGYCSGLINRYRGAFRYDVDMKSNQFYLGFGFRF